MVDERGVVADRLQCYVLIVFPPWVQRFMGGAGMGSRERENG